MNLNDIDDSPEELSLYELLAVGDDGESTSLGDDWLPTAMSAAEVQEVLMSLFWDPRLDAASCVPKVVTLCE
jgi:hypothetical protein